MKISIKQRLVGLIFIGIGIGYIGDLMGYWAFTIFFPGWWTLFFIIPGLWSIFKTGLHIWNSTCVLFGAYFMATANNWLSFRLSYRYLLPIFLILVGVKILFARSVVDKSEKKRKAYVNDQGYADIREEAIFTTHNMKEHGKINSVHVESVFSSVVVDLTDCDLHNLMFMTLETVIGNIEVRISDDVTPVVSSENVFGFCKYDHQSGSYEIPVHVSSVLGSIHIIQVPNHHYQDAEFKEK